MANSNALLTKFKRKLMKQEASHETTVLYLRKARQLLKWLGDQKIEPPFNSDHLFNYLVYLRDIKKISASHLDVEVVAVATFAKLVLNTYFNKKRVYVDAVRYKSDLYPIETVLRVLKKLKSPYYQIVYLSLITEEPLAKVLRLKIKDVSNKNITIHNVKHTLPDNLAYNINNIKKKSLSTYRDLLEEGHCPAHDERNIDQLYLFSTDLVNPKRVEVTQMDPKPINEATIRKMISRLAKANNAGGFTNLKQARLSFYKSGLSIAELNDRLSTP